MTAMQLIHILIHSFVLILITLLAWAISRLNQSAPRKVVNELLELMSDLDARHDRLEGKYKKLNANYALLLAREKRHANGEDDEADESGTVDTKIRPGEDLVAYKARMRALMAQGKLKHGE